MGVEVTQGRWFEPADDALSYEPVLINECLTRDLFGADDPLGKNIAPKPDETPRASRRSRGSAWWASSPTSGRTAS